MNQISNCCEYVTFLHKNKKNVRLVFDTKYKYGLHPTFEEKPGKGQNKTVLQNKDLICRNFIEFDQKCNF